MDEKFLQHSNNSNIVATSVISSKKSSDLERNDKLTVSSCGSQDSNLNVLLKSSTAKNALFCQKQSKKMEFNSIAERKQTFEIFDKQITNTSTVDLSQNQNSYVEETLECEQFEISENQKTGCIVDVKEDGTPKPEETGPNEENKLVEEPLNLNGQKNVHGKDPFALSSDEEYPDLIKYKPLKRKSVNCNKCDASHSSENRKKVKTISVKRNIKHSVCIPDSLQLSDCLSSNSLLGSQDMRRKMRVSYVHNEVLKERANNQNRIQGRDTRHKKLVEFRLSRLKGLKQYWAELVHSLISAFGLLQYLNVLSPVEATEEEISGFHGMDYINFLKRISCLKEPDDGLAQIVNEEEDDYGLSYDCPPYQGMFETSALISGGTITAAQSLVDDSTDIAINWYGGWHHAKRSRASGFCYINDIVLGILKLREKYSRVLYVDLDLHHGDGVEEAFSTTPKVMTVSFHKYEDGFFPGSGSLYDVGKGKGKYFALNVPLKDGIRDAQFCETFSSVMRHVHAKFLPEAVVVQCGADGLNGDPMASFNLTHIGMARCVCLLLTWHIPTLLLGGGGYNFPNTAKCWAYLTALAVGRKLPSDIPEHQHFLEYGPHFEMSTIMGNRKDCNTKHYLQQVVATVSWHMKHLSL